MKNARKQHQRARITQDTAFCILPSAFPVSHLLLARARHRWHKGNQRMKKLLCLGLVCFGFTLALPAQEQAAAHRKVFQIGTADGAYHEFALAGNYGGYLQAFPHDADFVVGRNDPAKDWPWIQPGPTDAWAAAGRILSDHVRPAPGRRRLLPPGARFCGYHGAQPPGLTVGINGTSLKLRCPPGAGDESLSKPKVGKTYALQQVFPADAAAGRAPTPSPSQNDVGSWALYDDVRLESGVPPPAEPLRVQAAAQKAATDTVAAATKVLKNATVENISSPPAAAQ